MWKIKFWWIRLQHYQERVCPAQGLRSFLEEHLWGFCCRLLWQSWLCLRLCRFPVCGLPLQFHSTCLWRNKENVVCFVCIWIVFKAIAFFYKLLVFLFKCGWDVFLEDKSCKDFTVICSGNVSPKFAGCVPNLLFKADGGGRWFGFWGFWFCHLYFLYFVDFNFFSLCILIINVVLKINIFILIFEGFYCWFKRFAFGNFLF